MSYEVKQPNIFGRIGAGLGQGLAENIPKEIERYRLSQGLKDIEGGEGTTLQNIAKLIQSGASDQQLQMLEPYIRGQAIRNKAGKQPAMTKGSPQIQTQPQGSPSVQPTEQPQPITEQPKAKGLPPSASTPSVTTVGGEQIGREAVLPATAEQKDALARELMIENPELYPTADHYGAAYQRAGDILDYPYQAQQRHLEAENRRKQQEAEIGNKFSTKLQQKGISNLPTDVQQRFLKKAENAVLKGKGIEKATEDISEIARQLSKDQITLENEIGGRGFFSKATPQLKADISKLRKSYADAGELELFKDTQKSSLDIGDHLASANAWPLTTEQAKIIADNLKEDNAVIAAKLGDTIKEDSSIFTLGYALDKSGIDDTEVINLISQLDDNGIINLNERQKRELANYYSLKDAGMNLGDILFNVMLGPFGYPLKAVKAGLNYATGQKEKVGPMERLKQSFGKE